MGSRASNVFEYVLIAISDVYKRQAYQLVFHLFRGAVFLVLFLEGDHPVSYTHLCDQGDTVKVTLCKGLYDIPIIKDLHTE